MSKNEKNRLAKNLPQATTPEMELEDPKSERRRRASMATSVEDDVLRWEHAGTTYIYREADGIAVLSIGGVFSEATFHAFRAHLLQYLTVGRLGGLIVDLRKAVVALDSDALDVPVPLDDLDEQARRTPVALVVEPHVEPLALEWMWEMTAAGLVRGVAGDEREARAWIAAMAGRRRA